MGALRKSPTESDDDPFIPMSVPHVNGRRSIGGVYIERSIYRECNSASQSEETVPFNSVMDLKLVRSKYNARREAKTSMSSLPVPNKSERDRSFDKPSHLPIGIAAIEIKALEAFLHREGIAHLN